MSPDEFRSRLKGLDLTIGGFAAVVGVHPTTASYWGRVRVRPGGRVQEFPRWVALLLDAWEDRDERDPLPTCPNEGE